MIGFIARIAGAATPLLITAVDHALSSLSPGTTEDAECGIRYNSDGSTLHVRQATAGNLSLEDWNLGGAGSAWYVRAVRTGGTKAGLDLGNLNTWEQLNANRSYLIIDTSDNDVAETIFLTISFSNDGGTTTYTTVDVTLTANTLST